MNNTCLKVSANVVNTPLITTINEVSQRLNIKCGVVCTLVEPSVLYVFDSALISNHKILYQEQTRYVLQNN